MRKETKRQKFVRIAETRTNSVLEKVRVLSNCSNPYAYEYTNEDVREIFGTIEQALKKARAKFEDGSHGELTKFQLTSRREVAGEGGRVVAERRSMQEDANEQVSEVP